MEDLKTIDPAKVAEKEQEIPAHVASKEDTIIQKFMGKRTKELKDFRKSLGIEKEWDEADREYLVTSTEAAATRKFYEEDQDVGLRSRLVPITDEGEDWRSQNTDTSLLNKIQTALSVIIEKNPEASLVATNRESQANTEVAYALWKRNWQITGGTNVYKLFAFNLMKYGWAVGRSFPRVLKYTKDVLVEKDDETPEHNKYEEKEFTIFNDVDKEVLDPRSVWIDEMTQPYKPWTMNDCYYEIDYGKDAAEVEFGMYKNWDEAKKGADLQVKQTDEKVKDPQKDAAYSLRKDIITIGFYQNRLKDLYIIWVPKNKVVLHHSPLPNDDGFLDIFQSMWVLRDAKLPYGISLWKMIRQDKLLFDKMNNMTMDQLELAIMKMFFYTGTSNLMGDNKIQIVPGKGVQIQNGDIKWIEIPPPGPEAWQGLQYLKARIDESSGVSPALEGNFGSSGGKKPTLGQQLQAKEAALKRLRVPLDNISDAISQDFYITFSWMRQVYTTPDVKEFTTAQELMEYEQENQVKHSQLYQKMNDQNQPEGIQATFLPELALHLEDRNGQLFESKKSKFFQVGKDIKTSQLNWKGQFHVIPKTLLAPSAELEKQRKSEVFNLLMPFLEKPPEIYAKGVKQLLKVNEEDPQDWLPDTWMADEQKKNQLFMADPNHPANQPQVGPDGKPLDPSTMQNQAGTKPNAGGPTVVPRNQVQGAQRGGIVGAVRRAFGGQG